MIIVHILLWILKIAGLLLLFAFGLFLTGILIILFVPVRYELSAQGDIKEKEKIRAWVTVRYFFRLIRFRASYENQNFQWEARIAWRKIGQAKEELIKEETEKNPETHSMPEEMPKREPVRSGHPGTETRERKSGSESVKEEKSSQKEDFTKKTKKKKSRLREEKEGLADRIQKKIKYTFQIICDKIKALTDIKDRVEKFIKDEVHQAAFRKGKQIVFHLIKKWMPKKAEGHVEYGFDDPYYTGKLLSYLALFYPLFGTWLRIVPDFENTALKGHVYIKGHLRMNHLAAAAVRLVADKNIRSTVKEVLRLIRHQKKEES